MTQYIYKYLKYIPLDIKNISNDINLNVCLKGIEYIIDKKCFCQMCSSTQDFNINLKIIKKPEILIILILNHNKNGKINIPIYLYRNSYKLICVEAKTK